MSTSTQAPLFSGPVVKICGLRAPAHAATAARAGADLIGMILAPSPRQITPEQARLVVRAAKDASDGGVAAVGVFVNATAPEINAAIKIADLDLVQLHGDEPPALLVTLDRPAIKVIRPAPGTSRADLLRTIAAYLDAPVRPMALLVEGFSPAAHGGVGARADWTLARAVIEDISYPVLLAGGLTPENVAEAIATVGPAGVDTSSGVERDGAKDHARIEAFVANARAAFAARTKPIPTT